MRDYRHAYKMPWSQEARLRTRYLASQDPVKGDTELNLDSTPHNPVHYYEMPKFKMPRKRKATVQHRREIEEGDHITLGMTNVFIQGG